MKQHKNPGKADGKYVLSSSALELVFEYQSSTAIGIWILESRPWYIWRWVRSVTSLGLMSFTS